MWEGTKLKKKFRFLAAFLCLCMMLTSNASYVLAASVSGNGDMLAEEESIPTVTETGEETQSDEQVPSQEPQSSVPEDEQPGATQPVQGEGSSEETFVEPSSEIPSEIEPSEEATETDSAEETEDPSTQEETGTESLIEDETEAETVTETETEMETEVFDVSGNDISGNDIGLLSVSGNDITVMALQPAKLGTVLKIKDGNSLEFQEGKTSRDLPKVIDEEVWKEFDASGEVTNIPAGIFDTSSSPVTEFYIAKSVTSIDSGAFSGAAALKDITFEAGTGLTALPTNLFEDCKALGSGHAVEIPEGIQTIEEDCFQDCSGMGQVILPSTLQTIKKHAFDGCISLTEISFYDATALQTIEGNAFKDTKIHDPKFPAGLQKIGESAFENCGSLGTVTLTEVTSLTLEEGAFLNSGVRDIKFGTGLQEIPANAFKGCTLLGKRESGSEPLTLTIKGVKRIKGGAFEGCTSLKNLVLEESVADLGGDAFKGCNALSVVEIRSGGEEAELGSTIKLVYNSLPVNPGMVIKGYGGTVETWAGDQGLKYESLYPQYEIQYIHSSQEAEYKVTGPTKARVGDTVTIKVTPKTGYSVVSVASRSRTVDANNSLVIKPQDVDQDSRKIPIDIVYAKKGNASGYKIGVSEGDTKLLTNGNLTFPSTLMSTKLIITKEGVQTGSWAWSYKSSDSKKVSVDAEGNLRALAPTAEGKPVTVTATLVQDTTVKLSITVEVGKEIHIKEVKGFEIPKGEEVSGVKFLDEGQKLDGMQVLQTSKAIVNNALNNKTTKNVVVKALAVSDSEPESNIDASYTWESGDTGVVKVAKKSTGNAQNTIIICGVGTTVITATSSLKDKDGKYPAGQFIVQVVDKTPYLEASSITIDTGKNEPGTEITMIPVEGTTISENAVAVVDSKKEEVYDFTATFDQASQKLTLTLDESSTWNSGKKYTLTNYYLQVFVDSEESVPCYIKLPSISITNTTPKPSVKMSGKLNLFFGAGEKQATVTATVSSLKGYELESVALEDLDTKPENKGFATNFSVQQEDEKDPNKLTITMQEGFANNETKKAPVMTGYLRLTYKGYDPVKVKVTVPSATTKPSYAITPTSVTTNQWAKKQVYEIEVLDSKTKEKIALDGLTADIDAVKSSGFFSTFFPKEINETELGWKLTVDEEKDVLRLELPRGAEGISSSAKAYINLMPDPKKESSGWRENSVLTYTFTIKVDKNLPKASLGTSTIKISQNYYKSNSTTMKLNQSDVEIIKIESAPKSTKANVLTEANKIELKWNPGEAGAPGELVAAIKSEYQSDNQPKAGTYSYTVTPSVRFTSEAEDQETKINPVTVSVKIENVQPYIKLKSATFALNTKFAGEDKEGTPVEEARQGITWVSLPTDAELGLDIVPDISSVEIYDSKGQNKVEPAPIKIGVVKQTELVKGVETQVPYLTVSLTEYAKKLKGTQTYLLKGLKNNNIEVKDLSIKVNYVTTDPTVSLSAKGSINVLDEDSAIVYTAKLKNFVGEVDIEKSSVISETDANGGLIYEKDKLHFKLEPVMKTDAAGMPTQETVANQFRLVANPDNSATNKNLESRKYTLQLWLVVGDEDDYVPVKLTVTPKQTMPKLTVGATSMNFYMNLPNYKREVEVTPKTGSVARITNIKWGAKASEQVKRAFCEPVYDAQSGKLTVQIKNPALLKKGSSYSLIYEIECENQLEKTTGTTFTIKVVMK